MYDTVCNVRIMQFRAMACLGFERVLCVEVLVEARGFVELRRE